MESDQVYQGRLTKYAIIWSLTCSLPFWDLFFLFSFPVLEICLLNEPRIGSILPTLERERERCRTEGSMSLYTIFELWTNGGPVTFGSSGIFAVNAS
jgi:hypothetical protein